MDKASRVSAGFTFTISALVISLTLISMAQFSSDWRRSQQASSEMTPSKLPFGIQNSLASDFSSILGVKANADRTGTYSARSKVEINFPFEQEGMNRKRVEKYPFLLGGAVSQSGLEVSLYLQPIIENKSVMLFPKNGSLDIGEDGQFEYAIYNHPEGWSLHEISIFINSEKSAKSIGNFQIQSFEGIPEPEPITYNLFYQEPGRAYNRTAIALSSHNASLQILYPDGTQVIISSRFSPFASKNTTAIYYTKSPGAYLVFPFQKDKFPLQDYYGKGFEFELGGGNPDSFPALVDGCISGTCYEFDGIDDYLNISSIDFSQSQPEFRKGPNRVQNGDFEQFSGKPDDMKETDFWNYWEIERGGASYFDATSNSKNGSYGLHIGVDASSNGFIWQKVENLLENTEYTLSFWAHGSPQIRYAILNEKDWLQPNGEWGGDPYIFTVNASGTAYKKFEQKFVLPRGQSKATIQLYASPDSDVYFDDVQVRRTEGLNGGFEHYFSDWGPEGVGLLPEGVE